MASEHDTLIGGVRGYFRGAWRAWNDSWFSPRDPATLSLLRILVGSMLLYTHLVWSMGLEDFFHPTLGWTGELLPATHGGRAAGLPPDEAVPRYYFSYFKYIHWDWLRWTVHLFNLGVFFCLTIGLFSRTVAVLAWIAALSYVERVTPGAFFGLDKVNVMLSMYLMLGPCGARYSIDRLRRLRQGASAEVPPSAMATVATRLIQLHLCVIYLFGGLGKLQGEMWWTGGATWLAVANYEYRSLDMTWLSNVVDLGFAKLDLLYVVDFLTHATVFLELFYCVLVWNRWARPWVLGAAIGMHVFIGAAMGMITFGLVMIYANMSFIGPQAVRRVIDPLARRVTLALVGERSPGDASSTA